ncbi:PREDICTED: lithocholate 6-beta-hydroxylase-like, partial [Papilio polytes]|uniref:lithocholate 6-beta-hydroxylase-like n=1 Tax=Papilio polytes TaxID=76194 RepID=UPI00067673DD
PNKLRGMFPIIENTAKEFTIRIKDLISNTKNCRPLNDRGTGTNIEEVETENSTLVDSEKLVGGYTADAIVPCAFGLKSTVMDNPNDPFAVALQAFYEMSLFNIFEKTMRQFWPAFVLFFRMRIIPKKTHDFFYNIVTSVLRARENGVQEKRGDFIDMMMTLRSDDKNNNAPKSELENDVEI